MRTGCFVDYKMCQTNPWISTASKYEECFLSGASWSHIRIRGEYMEEQSTEPGQQLPVNEMWTMDRGQHYVQKQHNRQHTILEIDKQWGQIKPTAILDGEDAKKSHTDTWIKNLFPSSNLSNLQP